MEGNTVVVISKWQYMCTFINIQMYCKHRTSIQSATGTCIKLLYSGCCYDNYPEANVRSAPSICVWAI